MVDYVGSLKRPFSDLMTLGIGTVVGMIPLAGPLLLTGYGAMVAKGVFSNETTQPKWELSKIVEYILNAIKIVVVMLVYEIPGLIVLIAGGAGIFLSVVTGGITNPNAFSSVGPGLVLLMLGFLLVLIGTLFSAMGIMNMLKENRLGAAFSFGVVIRKTLTLKCLVTLILFIVLYVLLAVLMMALLIVPILWWILYGLVTFIMVSYGYSLLAQVYNETPFP
ncbi:MAG: DUF4013 domain-containing protein [Candidatus Diapherotrites archaeon]|nr:DUF4013 domain-containing protein [Candidatus Diapherotrites archaeon]